MKGRGPGPPSSKTSEKVQKDIMSTRPSHWRMVLASGGADVGGVAGFVVAGDVPLGPEERHGGFAGGFHLVADFGDGAADALVHGEVGGDVVAGDEHVFDGVVGVAVAGDEVDGDVVVGGVLEEGVDPLGGGGGGAADAEARVDGLEVACGVVVELEVAALVRDASPEVDVGLVPDFEVPLRDLVDAVALDEVAGEGGDEAVPLLVGLGRGDIGLVPEGVEGVGVEGELFGHEADLDDGADAVGEEAVVDLIDVGEVVDGVAVLVFVVDADLVVEDGVEADVAEVGDLLHGAQVAAVAVAQCEDAARPEPNICSQK